MSDKIISIKFAMFTLIYLLYFPTFSLNYNINKIMSYNNAILAIKTPSKFSYIRHFVSILAKLRVTIDSRIVASKVSILQIRDASACFQTDAMGPKTWKGELLRQNLKEIEFF